MCMRSPGRDAGTNGCNGALVGFLCTNWQESQALVQASMSASMPDHHTYERMTPFIFHNTNMACVKLIKYLSSKLDLLPSFPITEHYHRRIICYDDWSTVENLTDLLATYPANHLVCTSSAMTTMGLFELRTWYVRSWQVTPQLIERDSHLRL